MENKCANCPVLEIYVSCPYKWYRCDEEPVRNKKPKKKGDYENEEIN